MLTEIQPCDPPQVFRARTSGPSMGLDWAVLHFLESQRAGVPLAAITEAVGSTTHKVHGRVQALVARGLVHRDPVPGGPARGPGASVYRLNRAASWTCQS